MARSFSRAKSRRRRYSKSISSRESCGPLSASTAAFWAIEFGLEVDWLWSLAAAETTRGGASTKPMRQPVMAYILESEPATMTVLRAPGVEATENGRLSYTRWQ